MRVNSQEVLLTLLGLRSSASRYWGLEGNCDLKAIVRESEVHNGYNTTLWEGGQYVSSSSHFPTFCSSSSPVCKRIVHLGVQNNFSSS